jgi:hypothetical protein
MRCIPTHVRMSSADPERPRAMCALLAELRTRHLDTGSDPMQIHQGVCWQYVCSTPFRRDDNAIIYLHVFYHAWHPVTDEPITIGIPATPAWWPDASCEMLSPPRSEPTARLRLVS